jgi:hypothetical protein
MDSHPQLIVYPEETIFFRRCLPLVEGRALVDQLALADQHLIHIFTWNRENPPASQNAYPDRDYAHMSFEAVRQEMRRLAEKTPPPQRSAQRATGWQQRQARHRHAAGGKSS